MAFRLLLLSAPFVVALALVVVLNATNASPGATGCPTTSLDTATSTAFRRWG
jgi:hypothetical protein